MKRMFRFAKTAALVLAGASLVVSCQKDSPNGEITTEDGGVVTVKSALVVTGEDERDLGTASNWLGSSGMLSFLKPSKQIDQSYLEDVPTGIEMLQDGFLYVSFVGNSASFNNVLGYYHYNPADLSELDEAGAQEYILNQIFEGGNTLKVKQVVYSYTKGLEFGTTYKLGAYEGDVLKEFGKGTVVGFYLLPNASSDGSTPKVAMKGNRPVFIATDSQLNRVDANSEGKVSHIMGKSSCGDLVIAFEDRNSLYSQNSDEDFNDLVFLVGDNLKSRHTTVVNYYVAPAKPFEMDDAQIFGASENCLTCVDDAEAKVKLGNIFTEGRSKTAKSEFDVLFGGPSRDGYVEATGTTSLYAYPEYNGGTFYNTIGWYYYEPGQSADDIKKSVTVDGTVDGVINPEYIIYKNISKFAAAPTKEFVKINKATPSFPANKRIGFFIVPKYGLQGENVKFAGNGKNATFTTINTDQNQAQMILEGSCNSLMVAFEDNSDKDYNDIIFSISDNNQNLKVSKIKFGNFYSLTELVEALGY
jgi:hypothetical protein